MNQSERERYSRQMILAEVGEAGQAKLRDARVLLVGVGGLGCASAQYLAAAGIGTIGLADDDRVERHNLARQILYGDADVGKIKVDCAAQRLRAINPEIRVNALNLRVQAHNAEILLQDYDVVIDGSDNLQTRYILNDACFFSGRPLIFAGIHRFEGQVAVFDTPDTACYRCLYPQPPTAELLPDCAEVGVLGVLPGMIGVMQANELIKLCLGLPSSARGAMLHLNMLQSGLEVLKIPYDPECSLCSPHATINSMTEPLGTLAPKSNKAEVAYITAAELKEQMQADGLQLVDVRTQAEYKQGHIAGAFNLPAHRPGLDSLESAELLQIVLYCAAENRALAVQQQLAEQGLKNVQVLRGGFAAWKREHS